MNKLYLVRWYNRTDLGPLGSVSFMAKSDSEAIAKADKTGREIGLPTSARTISRDYRVIHHKV